jgi:MraZ protein
LWEIIVARFRGTFNYSIDNKGRVNIPSKFRNLLSEDGNDTVIICRGPQNCLRAYPLDSWEKFEDELIARRERAEVTRIRRKLYSTLTDQTIDSQGRITLSVKQMEIAGITKEVTLSGQANFIEIWDKVKFEQFQEENEDSFDELFYQSVDAGI